MFVISADWAVGRRGRPVHMVSVNGRSISADARKVARAIQGPPKAAIIEAVRYAKSEGPVELFPGPAGWQARTPK